jgi:uncharacterized protein with PIN domain
MPDKLVCPNCEQPVAPLRGGSYAASVDIEAGEASEVLRTNLEVEHRDCPSCATKLERTAAPGQPWHIR